MVQHKLARSRKPCIDFVTQSLDAQVKRLDVRDQRRIGLAVVLEVQRPFDDRKIPVDDGGPAHFEAGGRIGKTGFLFHSVRVQFARRHTRGELGDDVFESLVAVHERERQTLREGGRPGRIGNRQVTHVNGAVVGECYHGIDPHRLIAADSVASIAHLQLKLSRAVQVHADGDTSLPFPHNFGAK